MSVCQDSAVFLKLRVAGLSKYLSMLNVDFQAMIWYTEYFLLCNQVSELHKAHVHFHSNQIKVFSNHQKK